MSEPRKCPVCDKVFHWRADEDSAIVDAHGERWESCRENAHWKLTFHMVAEHPNEGFQCPRRGEGGFNMPGNDHWEYRSGLKHCSYCGSLSPEDLFRSIEAGSELGPTDKNYKVYVTAAHPNPDGDRVVSSANFEQTGPGWIKVTKENRDELVEKYGASAGGPLPNWIRVGKNGPALHTKFYFQHLSADEQRRFIDLLNAKSINVGEPGYFYRLPFFVKREDKEPQVAASA